MVLRGKKRYSPKNMPVDFNRLVKKPRPERVPAAELVKLRPKKSPQWLRAKVKLSVEECEQAIAGIGQSGKLTEKQKTELSERKLN